MASLLPEGKQSFTGSDGLPLVGGKLYTYDAGTTTPRPTYSDASGTTPNTNPVILDSRGEATVFWFGSYKVVLKDASDVTVWTVDGVVTPQSAADLANSSDASKGAALVGFDGTDLAVFFKSKNLRVVDSISTLKTLDKTKYTRAFVTGYYSAQDGGGGEYCYDSSDTTTTDNGGTVIVAADGGRWKLVSIANQISVKQFGAVGNGTTYDDTAINNWIAYLLSSGRSGFVPSGNYRMAGRWLVDVALSSTRTIKIAGEGAARSKFYIESTTSPAAHIYASTGFDHFQHQIESLGFEFNTPLTGFALGKSDFSDAPGNSHFKDVYLGNTNSTNATGAITLQINYAFDSRFDNVIAVGKVGYGVALDVRQANFCTFTGGSYSNASYGILIRDGVNRANTFVGIDIENVDYCISNTSASTVNQLFVGGFWDLWRPDLGVIGTAGVSTSAGGKGCIVIDNVHSTRAGAELYGGVFLAANAKDNNGRVQVRGFYGSSTPTMPGNGVTINNATGQTQHVIIYGGTVSKVFIRGVDTGLTSGSFVLTPGDYIAIQYSVAPSWTWYPIY